MFVSRFQTNEILEALSRGIGVYETIRTYEGKPFALAEHYERLAKSLRYLQVEPPTMREFEKVVYDNLSERLRVVYVYWKTLAWYVLKENTEDFRTDYVKLEITKIRRADPWSIPPDLKSLGRPDIYLARLTKGDNYDVILLGSRGQVCEGTFSNIFLVKHDKIVTPSLESGILDGITRAHVIRFLREGGYLVEERFVEPAELFEAEEIFLTHTSRGIVPVNQIGRVTVQSTELGKTLAMKFEEYVKCLI